MQRWRVMCRRGGVLGALLLAALSLATGAAHAEPPGLRMLVAAGPGSGWDQTARNLAEALQQAGVVSRVQFDNRAGSGGLAGLAQFVTATGIDGPSLLVGGAGLVGSVALNRPAFNLGMVTPVARLTTEYMVVVVPPSSPLHHLKDLLDHLREAPGTTALGGGPAGSADHLLALLIGAQAGLDATRLQYRAYDDGGAEQSAVLSGQVAAVVAGHGEYAEQIRAGKLRALAVSSAARIDGIATLREQGMDVEFGNWRGVFGPPGATAQERDQLVAMVRKALDSPVWRATVHRLGWVPAPLYGDDFRQQVELETARAERAYAPAPASAAGSAPQR